MTQPGIAKKTRVTANGTLAGSRALPSTKAATPNGAAKLSPSAPKVKHKLIRDSFTMPKAEYEVLEALKVRAANLKRPIKKSELLRAGVAALEAMTDKTFLSALNGVQSLKTGRPKGEGKAASEP